MRNLILSSLMVFVVQVIASAQIGLNLRKIPFEFVEGYGVFMPGFAQLTETSFEESEPWAVTDVPVTGIPANWGKIVKKLIPLDMLQFVYQNYKAGKLSKDDYNIYARDYWNVDDRKLSERAIKCFVYLIYTKGEDGSIRCMVDTNNDLDFKNELEFNPRLLDFKNTASYPKAALRVKYERVLNGKVLGSDFPLVVVYDSTRGRLSYNIPVYGKANFSGNNGKQVHLQMNTGFTNLNFDESAITEFNPTDSESKVELDQLARQGQYLTIDDKSYQNLGVDINRMIVKLQEVEKIAVSNQVGYAAPQVKGSSLLNGYKINSNDYKGEKYILLDFWATWCAPCIKELSNLKRLKVNVDPSQLEIIGIVPDENDELLKRTCEKYGVNWPQIKSNSHNNIIKDYSISAFPSTILIDKSGVIVAVGLRGNELEKKINELVEKK